MPSDSPAADPGAATDVDTDDSDTDDSDTEECTADDQSAAASEANEPFAPVAYTPIHSWDADDRPREKLIKHGPANMADAEMIALLFGTGTRTSDGPISAVQLARSVLKTFDTLHNLSMRPLKELTRVPGIGPAKATTLMAAFEIGRRVQSRERGERVQVTSPDDVNAVFGPLMRDLKKEIFRVVHLNTANVILQDYIISEGGLAASIVEPRAVFEQAILENAASIICLHNHPSGNPEPSREDIRITRQLVEAGATMGIPVHDHIIIAGDTFTSLAQRGVIDA